jgi:hypothetical protein
MADVIGLSDVSSPDTGKGSQLKTGGKRKYNMKIPKNKVKGAMDKIKPWKSKDKCAQWKKLGYSSLAGCKHDNPKKPVSKKDRMKMMEAKKGK